MRRRQSVLPQGARWSRGRVGKGGSQRVAHSEIRILLVEDNPTDFKVTQGMFEGVLLDVGFDLETATDIDAGIRRAAGRLFDVGLLSLDLSGGRGLDLLALFREAAPQLPVVVLGARGEETLGLEAIRRGAEDWLVKGEVTIPLLARSLFGAVERHRLALAQRMDGVGQLAGGVAHDFNNLLMVISGYNDIIASRCAEDGLLRESSEQIHKAVGRAAALTSQLLSFSRKAAVHPVLLDLNDAIRRAVKRLEPLVRQDIRLVLDLAPQLAPTVADPAQLEQILVNLAANAQDAMPGGGTLTLSTANAEDFVALRVWDTGRGMDAEAISRLFEPFSAMKRPRGVAGLGLSTVRAMVNQCGGEIRVESTPGGGTTFSLYFPASVGVVCSAADGAAGGETVLGTERLLIVDDEPEVVTVLKEALVSGGYMVTTATRREKALAICAAPNERVDMVLVDVVMPGMRVTDFIREIHRSKPGAKVALISGYSGGDDAALAEKADLFLSKPIERPTLLRELRRVLDVR